MSIYKQCRTQLPAVVQTITGGFESGSLDLEPQALPLGPCFLNIEQLTYRRFRAFLRPCREYYTKFY